MIILYEENELKFESLGIGVLKDAISCYVKEVLNDSFELEMSYPVSGSFYDDLKIGRIISVKPNPFEDSQPFRIGYISKPIDGIIVIHAYHISYDMNGIIVGPISANNLSETLVQLKNKTVLAHNFTFSSDVQISKTFSTTNYYNLRSLLFGSDKSILETYEVDLKLDKFNVYLLKNRGKNLESQIRYGKNMTNLNHEISYERLYNGVYPYYHKETASASTQISSDEFTKVYIVGNNHLRDGWLSFSENGEPYHPLNESPVQIATQGEYYNRVFAWDSTKQKYVEKLYEQTVTLIEGVISPEWIIIDWTGLPNIVVKANKPGYFKMVTDTEYEYHDVGDIVFKGSIRSAMSSLVLYYSEVIPGQNVESNEIADSVEHIELTDKILWINTDLAKEMKFNRILALDVTSDFKDDEEVNDENIKKKALKYIEDNKIGQYKYTTSVSFVDLNSTTEDVIYKNLDKLEIGDTVKVIYDYIGVDVELRVISATYNALTDKYDSIELGEKPEKISESSVQTGDSISSLSNDKGYTTISEVNKIVANIITADYIQAKNAKFTKAQIEELQTARIKCTGILEASQFEIDKLVAKLLVSDNAEIKNTLTAGEIKVSGDITIKSGEIYIQNDTGSKVFNVDREGNLTATSATIKGTIEANDGVIGGFTIDNTAIYKNIDSMESDTEDGVYIGPDGISLGKQLKIYPTGVISSIPNLSIIDPNSPEAMLANNLVSRSNSKVIDIGVTLKGSYTVEDINTLGITQGFNVDDVVNVKNDGAVTNEDGTTLDVKVGDNIIVVINEVSNVQYRFWNKISNAMYVETYAYQGKVATSWLNHLLSLDPITIEYGYIYQIEEVDETLSDISVSPGDYIVFIPSSGSSVTWSKFYYAEATSSTFFGITPDGILYANGAVISGDITVKSGEISIQNDNGSKVFKVDRDGNLYADSATIKGDIIGGSMNINNNFIVNPDGSVTAKNITATGGQIGGLTIASDHIGFDNTSYSSTGNSYMNKNSIKSNRLYLYSSSSGNSFRINPSTHADCIDIWKGLNESTFPIWNIGCGRGNLGGTDSDYVVGYYVKAIDAGSSDDITILKTEHKFSSVIGVFIGVKANYGIAHYTIDQNDNVNIYKASGTQGFSVVIFGLVRNISAN